MKKNKLHKWLYNTFGIKRSYQCDCSDLECRRSMYVTENGSLTQDNLHTCGHIKKHIKELNKL